MPGMYSVIGDCCRLVLQLLEPRDAGEGPQRLLGEQPLLGLRLSQDQRRNESHRNRRQGRGDQDLQQPRPDRREANPGHRRLQHLPVTRSAR